MVPEDLANAESRKRFIDGLPPWLYGTVGGNSLCVSVDVEGGNEPFVFDCGSGLREMGIVCSAANPAPSQYHIFFSHFHWDHLLGFPFFSPAYNPSVTLDFYAPKPGIEKGLRTMMSEPHFPVRLENMMSQKRFHLLESPVSIGQTAAGPVSISFKKMKHPGDSFSYALDHNGKRFIYATDVELTPADFEPNEENTGFFKGADLIALDSQYTLGEAMEKYNWGHTAFSVAVEFAVNWGIQHLVMLHHEPAYDDHKLYEILQSARRHLQRMDAVNKIEISLAVEGLEIAL
jgi:phosphoribosyl 1,2-cyclic phosphodiesterase